VSDPVIVNTSVYSVGGYDSADFDFTLTGSVTAGNVLLVEMHTNGNSPVNLAISDDQTGPTNTYDHKGHSYLDPVGIGYWTCVVANGGTVALHVQKFGQTSIVGLVVHEVSGVDTDRVTDGLPVFATGTGNNPLVTMNETSVPNDLLIGSYVSIETVTLNTPETGWTADQTFTFGGSMHAASEKRFPAAWGTFTAGWPAITNASARRWMIGAIALIGIPITPTIQSFDTLEPRDGGNLTINGVYFGASQGVSGSVTVGGVTAAVTSWSNTSIAVVVRLGANPYGVSVGVQVNTDAAGSSNIAHLTQILPASGWKYLVMGDPFPDPDRRVKAEPEPEAGNQMNWETVGDLVDLDDDGTGTVDPSVDGFRVRFWAEGFGWGAIARQSFDAAVEFEPVLPAWPSSLPSPRVEIQSIERRALSQIPGAEVARARSLDYYGTLQVTWVFTRAELATFKSYGETDLSEWTGWTSMPLPGRTGTTPYKPVRFIGKPSERVTSWNADGPITTITAQLEQRGHSVI